MGNERDSGIVRVAGKAYLIASRTIASGYTVYAVEDDREVGAFWVDEDDAGVHPSKEVLAEDGGVTKSEIRAIAVAGIAAGLVQRPSQKWKLGT
jgi:hypothetical protein